MPTLLPDYAACPANLGCSMLRHFGITPPNGTLALADALLETPVKNIVLLLLDGLGVNILEKHLSPDGFLRRRLVGSYSSTFPPTTVASTTALLSGLTPNQNGWLGWSAWFPEVARNVSYFWNTDNDTGAKLPGRSLAETLLPYESIVDRIGQTGVSSRSLASFRMGEGRTFTRFCDLIHDATRVDGRTFTYAYWDEPDHTMHLEGTSSSRVHAMLQDIEENLERLAGALKDTLLFVTADHGHIDVSTVYLDDDPTLCDMLLHRPSFESRAVNFFVKREALDRFPAYFTARYGDAFTLLSKREVINRQLFGRGENHPRVEALLGDYLAIGTGRVQIVYTGKTFKGNHAGLTQEEMRIPLIAIRSVGAA